jgi:hypothetical protein
VIGRFVVRDTLSVSDTSHSQSTSFSVHFIHTSTISFVVKSCNLCVYDKVVVLRFEVVVLCFVLLFPFSYHLIQFSYLLV